MTELMINARNCGSSLHGGCVVERPASVRWRGDRASLNDGCGNNPALLKAGQIWGNCDRLQQHEARYPSHVLIETVFTPAGTGGPNGPIDGFLPYSHAAVFVIHIPPCSTTSRCFQGCRPSKMLGSLTQAQIHI